ncbi:MAG: hypothetical protein J6K40_01755 [Alistipes sp.]|nr:hypothetical protein [Alistipes sp.]
MLRSSIFAAIALVAVGCVGNSDATDSSVASHFESPEVEGGRYREACVALDKEYNTLAVERCEAYMLRDSASRAEALLTNSRAAEEHRERLRLTDSAWLSTARHFYDRGDGGFTALAEKFGSDSITLARRLLRL